MDDLGWGLGAGGCRKRSIQAEEGLEGLLRTVGKYWEVLRSTVSPSDCHWFEPKHEALSTLSPGHLTGIQVQPPAFCSLSSEKKGNLREGDSRENSRRGLLE